MLEAWLELAHGSSGACTRTSMCMPTALRAVPHPACPVLLLLQMVHELVPHLQAIAQDGSPLPVNIRRHALMVLHHLLNALSNMRGTFQKQVQRLCCAVPLPELMATAGSMRAQFRP
jgi:hypothetical protein